MPSETNVADEYTEGVCGDSAIILCNGVPLTITEILDGLKRAKKMEEALRHLGDLTQQDYRRLIAEITRLRAVLLHITELSAALSSSDSAMRQVVTRLGKIAEDGLSP